MTFSPDSKRLASAGWDKTAWTVKAGKVAGGKEMLTVRGRFGKVTSLAFSPDGKDLVTGCEDGTIRVWDARIGQEMLSLRGHTLPVTSLAFSADGRRLASTSGTDGSGRSGEIKVWETHSGQEVLSLTGHRGPINSVAFSPDGQRLASGSGDRGNPGKVKIWKADAAQRVFTRTGHLGGFRSVAFSADGRRLASAYRETVKVWEPTSGREILSLVGHSREVTSIAFSPEGRRLASGANAPLGTQNGFGEVKIWDLDSGLETLSLKEPYSLIYYLAFSPDGKRVAGAVDAVSVHRQADSPGKIKVWDSGTGREILTITGRSSAYTSVAFSPDGKRLVTGIMAYDSQRRPLHGEVKVWDSGNGQELVAMKALSNDIRWIGSNSANIILPIVSVVFSPDGRRLASSGGRLESDEPGEVRVWDSQTGQELLNLNAHAQPVASLAFSPDGKRLASGSWDRTVKLWDIDRGRVLITLTGHTGEITSVAFSPDGLRLASTGRYARNTSKLGELKVWEILNEQEALTHQ
jgi:WD40 repeat protein